MATNVFFRNYDNIYEQNLIDDLVIESIQIYGIDLIYLMRTRQGEDNILNEDEMPLYEEYYEFEAYVKNVDGFEGEGDFLSKFGLQIRDQVTLTVAIRTFERFVTRNNQNMIRPLEGDIIWLPLNQKMYEIKFVEHEQIFYQTGRLQTYDVRCELFEYSSERIDTGNTEIDIIEDKYTLNTLGYEFTLEDSSGIVNLEDGGSLLQEYTIETLDKSANNQYFQLESESILDFSETNPFSEIDRY